MCGRSSVNVSAEYIAIEANRACGTVGNVTWNARTRDHWVPRSNIHPGQLLPVIIRDAESGELYLEAVHWGLIPSFTPSDLKKPDFFRMFNSRSETCAELPSFRRLTTNQRCVVLLSGYFEWKNDWHGEKQPYCVHAGTEGEMLLVAGLYDQWQRLDGSVLTSVSLLTTKSADTPLDWLHHRCLCLLKGPAQIEAWLDNSPKVPPQKALEILHTQKVSESATLSPPRKEKGANDEVMRLAWHPVSKAVNKLDYVDADCTKRVSLESSPVRPITKFFKGSKESDTLTVAPTNSSSSDATLKRSNNSCDDVRSSHEGGKVKKAPAIDCARSRPADKGFSPMKKKSKATPPLPLPSSQRQISAFFGSSKSP